MDLLSKFQPNRYPITANFHLNIKKNVVLPFLEYSPLKRKKIEDSILEINERDFLEKTENSPSKSGDPSPVNKDDNFPLEQPSSTSSKDFSQTNSFIHFMKPREAFFLERAVTNNIHNINNKKDEQEDEEEKSFEKSKKGEQRIECSPFHSKKNKNNNFKHGSFSNKQEDGEDKKSKKSDKNNFFRSKANQIKRQAMRTTQVIKQNQPEKGAKSLIWSKFNQITIIKRFKNKMKERLIKRDIDSLSPFQISLLNDISHIALQFQFIPRITFEELKNKLKNLFFLLISQKSYSPDSSFFIIWKGLLVVRISIWFTLKIKFQVIYLMTILDVPLQFLENYSENSSFFRTTTFFYCPATLFLIEIFLNFNTGFYREGQIVEQKLEIFNNYIEVQFWLDSMSVCGFIISLIFPYAKSLFLLRIYNLFLQIRQFEDRAQFTQKYPSVWTLLKLFTLIFCVAHFCGCGFVIVAQNEFYNSGNSHTWIYKQSIENDSWETHYIYGLYFSFITMITVGYGDVVPQTNIERIYVICMTLISAAVFGYSLNTIGAIFQDISSKSLNYRILKRDIGQYMRSRSVDSQLQVKVFQHLSYFHLQKQSVCQGEEALNQLPSDLRLQIKKDYFGKTLHSSAFLTQNFSSDLINSLTFMAQEIHYRKGEFAFLRHDLDQRLLILTRGTVELIILHPALKEISLCKIEKGDVGSKGFITGQPREVSLRASSNCTFAFISIEDFMSTIKNYPLDYERYCMMRDLMMNYENENVQKMHCFSCRKYGHGIMNCPFIHLKKDREIIIRKYDFCPKQIRKKFTRNKLSKTQNFNLLQIRNLLRNFRADALHQIDINSKLPQEVLGNGTDKDFLMATDCFEFNSQTKQYCYQYDHDYPMNEEYQEYLEDNLSLYSDEECNSDENEEENSNNPQSKRHLESDQSSDYEISKGEIISSNNTKQKHDDIEKSQFRKESSIKKSNISQRKSLLMREEDDRSLRKSIKPCSKISLTLLSNQSGKRKPSNLKKKLTFSSNSPLLTCSQKNQRKIEFSKLRVTGSQNEETEGIISCTKFPKQKAKSTKSDQKRKSIELHYKSKVSHFSKRTSLPTKNIQYAHYLKPCGISRNKTLEFSQNKLETYQILHPETVFIPSNQKQGDFTSQGIFFVNRKNSKDHLLQNDQEMYLVHFDIAKDFVIYFPGGNYTSIIKNCKHKLIKKFSCQLVKGQKSQYSKNKAPSAFSNRQQAKAE